MLLKNYYPYEYVESVFTIDYKKLYELGYRGLIIDIDNTLVPHGADSTPEVDELITKIQSLGFTTLLLSNNDKARVERFLKNIDSLYICDSDKPNTEGFLKSVEKLNLDKKQTIVIGDQTYTDIIGANKSGLASILVKYIGFYKKDKKGIRRTIEKFVLFTYKLRNKYNHRLGGIELKE